MAETILAIAAMATVALHLRSFLSFLYLLGQNAGLRARTLELRDEMGKLLAERDRLLHG